MILHNPRVFYFQRLDPTGAGRRLLDLYTSFDGAKRLGSGKRTSIPPFLLVFSVQRRTDSKLDVE